MTLAKQFSSTSPLLIIGCGNMGRALLTGWQQAGLASDTVVIVDRHFTPSEAASATNPVTVVRDIAALDPQLRPRATLMAVKPHGITDAIVTLKARPIPPGLVISVAAGIGLMALESAAGAGASVIWAMPNTPAAAGAGVVGLAANGAASPEDKTLATTMMAAVGEALWVSDEEQMHSITALAGSGPAYVFHFVEALAQAGLDAGLAPDIARSAARQTLVGAAKMLSLNPESDPATLRQQVTSKGGTTAAGLACLQETGALTELIRKTVASAKARSLELGKTTTH